MIHRAYIGIGSNVGDPQANVRAAIEALASIGKVARASSLYHTKAWGVEDQPDYINAVVLLKTTLPPRMLLSALKSIEVDLGRTPGERWGPRIIDLDILTYDKLTIVEDGLAIPHKHLGDRAFVLVPLAEIDASFAPAYKLLDQTARAGVTIAASR